jgi:hypothetical protein
MTVKDWNLFSTTPTIQLQTGILHTLLIIGKNLAAGWNKLTSLPYNHKGMKNYLNIYIYERERDVT